MRRLFIGEPIWTAYDRPSEDHSNERKAYVAWMKTGFKGDPMPVA